MNEKSKTNKTTSSTTLSSLWTGFLNSALANTLLPTRLKKYLLETAAPSDKSSPVKPIEIEMRPISQQPKSPWDGLSAEQQSWEHSFESLTVYYENMYIPAFMTQDIVNDFHNQLINLENIIRHHPELLSSDRIKTQFRTAVDYHHAFMNIAAKKGLYLQNKTAYKNQMAHQKSGDGKIGSMYSYNFDLNTQVYIKHDKKATKQCAEVHRGLMIKMALEQLKKLGVDLKLDLQSPDIFFIKDIDPNTGQETISVGSRIIKNSVSLYQHVTDDNSTERALFFNAFNDNPKLLNNYPGIEILLALSLVVANFDLHEANIRPIIDKEGDQKLLGLGLIDFGERQKQPESEIHPHSHSRHNPLKGPRNFFKAIFPRVFRTSDRMAEAWLLHADPRIQAAMREANRLAILQIATTYPEGSAVFIEYAKDLGMKNANEKTTAKEVIEFYQTNVLDKRIKSAEIIGLGLKIERCIVKDQNGKFKLTNDIDALILKHPDFFMAGKFKFRTKEHDGLITKYQLAKLINERTKAVLNKDISIVHNLFRDTPEPLKSYFITKINKKLQEKTIKPDDLSKLTMKDANDPTNINIFLKALCDFLPKDQRIPANEFDNKITELLKLIALHQFTQFIGSSSDEIKTILIQHNLNLPSQPLNLTAENAAEELDQIRKKTVSYIQRNDNTILTPKEIEKIMPIYKEILDLEEKLNNDAKRLEIAKASLGGDQNQTLLASLPALQKRGREKELKAINEKLEKIPAQIKDLNDLKTQVTTQIKRSTPKVTVAPAETPKAGKKPITSTPKIPPKPGKVQSMVCAIEAKNLAKSSPSSRKGAQRS